MRRDAVLGFLFSFLLSFSLFAQSPNANIVGRVLDQSGAVIPGAQITIRHVATGEFREVVSDEKGEYTIAELAPGDYRIMVRKEGFRRLDERGLTLEVNQTVRLDLQLQVGALSEVVEVTASVPLLNTENPMKGDVIVSREMVDIPLDGRDFSDLAFLVPGVGEKAQGGQGSSFAVNGARADNTNFVIDGFNNQNLRLGGAQARPNLDAMQEFKMQTTGYTAEYGRLAGGTMNMVLKSGTNRPHGTLFEFVRNDALDARNFFDPEKTKLRRNQFGAMLDGPVYIPKVYNGRDRTFFLFSWESYRQILGDSQLTRVPSLLERQGDFSKSPDADGNPAKLVDPLNGAANACVSGKTGNCFPGNILPAARFDSIAKQIMPYYPLPNRAGINNYYAVGNDPDTWDNFLAKIDQRLRGSDSLSGRFLRRMDHSTDPFGGSETGLFASLGRPTQMLAGLSYTRLFSPTLINEARFGLTRSTQHETGGMMGHDYAADWGLAGSTNDPFLVGFPRIQANDMAAIGVEKNQPVLFTVNNYQWADTLTWVKGRHLVKFGGDVLRNQFFQPFYNNNRGTYVFNGYWTTVPFADFQIGILNKFSRTVGGNPNYLFFTSYGAFAQDDFRVTSNLTLNIGLRYELSKPPVEKYGRYSNFIPELGKLVLASEETVPNLRQYVADVGLTGLVSLKDEYGLPDALVYTPQKCFAPRFGFAWRPAGGVRTVVRGGYGIFYGNNVWNPIRKAMGDVFPFSVEETYSKANKQPKNLTFQNPLGVSTKLDGVLTPNGMQLRPDAAYLQSWNLTLEREIGKAMAVEVAYIGSKGTHLGRSSNINQPIRTLALQLSGGGFPRPISGFNDITYYAFNTNSIYNAGLLTLRKRFARGLFYRLNYVYSKSIDYGSQINGNGDGGDDPQDPRNLRLERARSDFDRGHSLSTMFMYDLPLRRHFLLSNWQIGGTGRFQTGQPFTVTTTSSQLDQGEANRPDRIAKGTLANPTPDMWYNVSAFRLVPNGAYRFGTSGRNILDGPGLMDLNVSLIKRLRIAERYNMQFRCEMFNALNHPNFNLPAKAVNAPDAGMITRTRSPRLIQFGLRLQF
jgi:outer membrane receptor protein involved in Fe transport